MSEIIADCQLPIVDFQTFGFNKIGNRQLAINEATSWIR